MIAASSGTSFVHETEGQVILNGSYDIGFTLDLALKDLGLALRLGADTGVPLELAELAERAFDEARERYGGSAWSPMVVQAARGRRRRGPAGAGLPGHARAVRAELRPELRRQLRRRRRRLQGCARRRRDPSGRIPLRGILLANKRQTASSSSSA